MEDKEKKKFNKKVVKKVAKQAANSVKKIEGKNNFNKKVVKKVEKSAKKIASAAKQEMKRRDLSTPLAPSIFAK